MSKCGAVVLCGGESKRMGRPKAWLPFQDETMLQRIVRQLSEITAPVVVVAAPDQDVPPLPSDVEIARDAKQSNGPLQGLEAGLSLLSDRVEAIYLSSCDVPFLQKTFVQRLFDLLDDYQIVVPHIEERYHPLAAVYRVEVLTRVRRLLSEDRRRPFFLFEEAKTRIVKADELQESDPTFQSLRNLNTPEEYEAALDELNE